MIDTSYFSSFGIWKGSESILLVNGDDNWIKCQTEKALQFYWRGRTLTKHPLYARYTLLLILRMAYKVSITIPIL